MLPKVSAGRDVVPDREQKHVRLVSQGQTFFANLMEVDNALDVGQEDDFADLVLPSGPRLTWNNLDRNSSTRYVVLVAPVDGADLAAADVLVEDEIVDTLTRELLVPVWDGHWLPLAVM
jgi:hypothetical protein